MTIITNHNMCSIPMNSKLLSVNDGQTNSLRSRGRSERASSLALPHSSLLDFYDKQQEQCNSVALLPSNVNVVVRRHSSHYYPMLEDKQQQQQQQQQHQQSHQQQQHQSLHHKQQQQLSHQQQQLNHQQQQQQLSPKHQQLSHQHQQLSPKQLNHQHQQQQQQQHLSQLQQHSYQKQQQQQYQQPQLQHQKSSSLSVGDEMSATMMTMTSMSSVVNTNENKYPSSTVPAAAAPNSSGLSSPPPPIPKRTFRGKYAWNCVAPTAAGATPTSPTRPPTSTATKSTAAVASGPSPTKNKQTAHTTPFSNFYQQQQQQQPLVYYQPQPEQGGGGGACGDPASQGLYVDLGSTRRQLYSDSGLDAGGLSDDDRMSLENSVFDESSVTSTPVKAGGKGGAGGGVANVGCGGIGAYVGGLLAGKALAGLTNEIQLSNAAKRANRSSSSTVDSTATTNSSTSSSSGYGSHSERLASTSTTADFRSRFSSVDTQSSLDSCLAEKANDSPVSKDSGFRIERETNGRSGGGDNSSIGENNMTDYNNQLNNNNNSSSNNEMIRMQQLIGSNNANNNRVAATTPPQTKLPTVPMRKQYSVPPKIPPPTQQQQQHQQQQATNSSQQSLSNGSKTSFSVSTSTSTSSAASAVSATSSGSSISLSAGSGGNAAISPVSQQQQQQKRPVQPPAPPSRAPGSFDSPTGNNKTMVDGETKAQATPPPPPLTIRNKLAKHRPPPIVYPKLHQRQDSNLSSDSFSVTSSPGYNSKSLMDAPLLQNASRINKSGPGMAMRHQDSSDSFGMTASRYGIGSMGCSSNPMAPPRSKINYRQDSTISSDSFSQTSSPGYNTKIMEAPLLPSVKRLCGVPAPIVCKQKLQNETIEEMEQTVPMSPLTKCVSTPASLQTIVRFQNGAPNTMSLQHRIINRRKSSNPYVTNGRLKFRLFQILLNAFALLAIAGGLAAYFNAYPTIKFVNKTIINTIRVEEVSTFGKNPAPGTCLPIIVKFCQGPLIPYNYTVFPNYIGHFGQVETQVDLEPYEALVDVRCYELVSLFLCTLFVPKCGVTGAAVPPCKTLCTETMRRCGFFFDVFGLSLPDYLNCKLFKDYDNPEECVGLEQVRDVMIAASNPVCNGFQCDQARCIPNDYVCDGHLDCMDQTDESSCDRCDKDSIYCGENRCMSSKHICDGVVDCPYGQDERNCIRLSERNGDLGKGVLEVFRISTHEWTPACVKNWDRSVSPTAVCSMLGYNSVNATSVVTQRTHRPLLTSVNVSTDIWKMYAKKRSNLMQEFSSCKPEEDYPIAELTCANFECGKVKRPRHNPSRRIIGGSKASPGSWPFLAAILGGPEKIFYCAGVLISDQWVLTASHCIGNHTVIDLENWTIQLGVTRRNSFAYSGQKVKVKNVIPHPMYNTQVAHDNDIALFQLAQRVSFHEHLLPVCLPPPGLKQLKADQLCTVIGWGKRADKDPNATYEPIVNEVQVPVIRRQQCDEWLDNLTVSDGMICAGYEEGGKDACQGDSGGPLLCPYPGEKDKWYVGGIVSWGIMCAHPKLPGVYANVVKYIPWILEQIQKYTKPSRDEEKISKFSNVPGGGAGSSLNISPGASPFKSNNNRKPYSNSNMNRSPMDIDYYGSYEKT